MPLTLKPVPSRSCFNGSIFEAITWASDYYHHPIGEVFFSFMPTLLRKQNDKIIIDLDDNTEYKLNEEDKKLKLTLSLIHI